MSLIHQLSSQSPVFHLNPKALLDQQRHHVRESPSSLGYTLQICRADEHPNAFQVTVERKNDYKLIYGKVSFFLSGW